MKQTYIFRNYLKQLRIPVMLIFLMACTSLYTLAQGDPVVAQNWTMIEKSNTMIDVSAQVIKCDTQSPAQLYLEIFNESSNDQKAHFKLTLTNPLTKAQEVHEISLMVEKAAIVKPSCKNSDYPSLRLKIPAGWDPATVQFTIAFII